MMTQYDFTDALKTLGWTQAMLCQKIKVHPNSASKWATGQRYVPGPVEAYLNLALRVKALQP